MNLLDQPTPRTDEAETANKFPGSKEYYEMVVHARQLETELATERARLKKIETALKDALSTYFGDDKLVTAERIEAWQAALKNNK